MARASSSTVHGPSERYQCTTLVQVLINANLMPWPDTATRERLATSGYEVAGQENIVAHTVAADPDSVLFAGIPAGTRFYFVHSYALRAAAAADLAAAGARISWTEHGERFAAAAEKGAGEVGGLLSATQFHPEKSGDAGAVVLSNWLATL